MMKKLLAMLLALVTLLSMAVVVSADETVLKEVVFADGVADDGWYAWIVKDDNFNGWWDKLQEENTQVVIKYTNSGSGDLYVSLTHWGSVNAVLATTVDGTDGYKYATVDASALVSAYKNDSGHYDDDNNIKIPNAMSMECWDTATESRLATIYSVSIVKNTTTEPDAVPSLYSCMFANSENVWFYVECEPISWNNTLMFKLLDADGNVLTETYRNPDRATSFENDFSLSIFAKGECSDGWLQTSWTPSADKVPTTVEMYIDGSYVTEVDADYRGLDWATSDAIGVELVGNAPAQDTTVPTYTGYFTTGDDTHAMIIGGAIITSNHVYNANGDCVYCGYHKDVVEDEVVIETPVESDTEEVDEDNTDDVEVDDTTTDTNPTTGVALAIAPMAMAALAVVASKRR